MIDFKFLKKERILLGLLVVVAVTNFANAAGMRPETSIVIVHEDDGDGSINVRNTDSSPALLYTKILDIEEDKEDLLIATPQVARVEPGKSQMVRFILTNDKPLETQRLKRVIFDGIPPKNDKKGLNIGVNARQNLPVLIHPAGLAKDNEPWKRLSWSIQDGALILENKSPYVVRMAQQVYLLPYGEQVDIGRTYILPGQEFSYPLNLNDKEIPSNVRIMPATIYGFVTDKFDAPVVKK